MRFRRILASLVTAPFLLLCSFLSAQETNVRTTVTVQLVDAAGSAISNAQAKFVQIESAYEKTVASDAMGKGQLELQPGEYDLTVAVVGFQALRRRIKISTSGSQRFDLTLQPGLCTECVEVIPVPSEPRETEKNRRGALKYIQSTVICTDRAYSPKLPDTGPACEKELFERRGRPFMFPVRNGIAYGISSDPNKVSELTLWIDNQSAEPVRAMSCCVATLFGEVEVFDSDGRRVLSKADREAQQAGSEGREMVDVCSCSVVFLIAPHTMQLFDFADISREYTLKPGRYTITERNPPHTFNLITEANQREHHGLAGLVISIP
jgi:Carboxypeptidase regulatory-like domain